MVRPGRLARQIPVRLVNLSLSGCLLESGRHVNPGASGELRVTLEGTPYRDAVQVVRAAERHGPRRLLLGGQFSWDSVPRRTPDVNTMRSIVPAGPRAV